MELFLSLLDHNLIVLPIVQPGYEDSATNKGGICAMQVSSGRSKKRIAKATFLINLAEPARGISGILWPMKFAHHGLQIEISDDWWTEAGMRGFVPTFTAYRVNQKLFPNAREVLIQDIGPVSPNPCIGIFNDSKAEGSARERVVRILRGFRFDDAIPPVEIVGAHPGRPYRYKLVHGAHRLYCSLAAGFKCVPAIEGFDKNP